MLRIDWRDGPRLDARVQLLGPGQGLPPSDKISGNLRLELLDGTLIVLGRETLLRHDSASDRFVAEVRIAGLAAEESSPFFFALGDGSFWCTKLAVPRRMGVVRPGGRGTWTAAWEPPSGFETVVPVTALLDSATQTVWLGGQQLASYNLSQPRLERPPPAARVRLLTNASEKPIWGDAAERLLQLRPEQNALNIHVAAPYFQANARGIVPIEYRTWLEGFDSAWSAWSRGTVRTYTNLPPGRFTFHVQAAAEGRRGPESTLAFTLLAPPPPWWRTWWFIGLAGTTGVSGVAGVTRWFAHRALRRRVQVLEAQAAVEAERLRLARDLHDDLGSGLGRVALLGSNALLRLDDRAAVETAFRKMTATAQTLSRSTREIVWAVNPHHDTVPELVEHLGALAEQILGEANIQCVVELAPDLPAVGFGAATRHGLLLAVKEALHNAVKYSGALTAEFSARVVDDSLEIVLRDFGGGFAPGECRGTGHGLKSIAARLAGLGGTGEITSVPEQGTTVRLKLPLPKP